MYICIFLNDLTQIYSLGIHVAFASVFDTASAELSLSGCRIVRTLWHSLRTPRGARGISRITQISSADRFKIDRKKG
jgi:hypothetical protein